MTEVLVHLRDLNRDVVAAWRAEFSDEPMVQLSEGEIFGASGDAIISPANSFGHMDGGIDLVYSNFFGWELEERLRLRLAEHHFGELPVGQAVIVKTNHASIPFLVSAPTMRVPGNISKTVNVYLAFRAALIAVLAHNEGAESPIRSLLVPGLGTGVGDMPPARAARQMKIAYRSILKGEAAQGRNIGAIWGEHHELMS
jgi:O-acetyl-ADP-ribose deacetylase (regulator of RNase III)